LAEAQRLGVPIVNEDFLDSLLTNGTKKTDVNKFLSAKVRPNLPTAFPQTLAQPLSSLQATLTPSGSSSTPATTSTASAASTATTTSTATATAKKLPPDGLGAHTKWVGLFNEASGDDYPIEVIVYYRNGNKFLAELRRPTLNIKTLVQVRPV